MNPYLFFLFFLCPFFLSAQDYQQICRPGITFFQGADGYFKAFRRDSVAPAGNNDTAFFSYHAVRDSTGYGAFTCRDTTAGDALGLKILKQQNGWFRFFNRHHDTISINTQAALNDSWRYCNLGGGNHIQATVSAILTDSVINATDPVKVITLQSKNSAGANIAGIFNGKILKLSKHYGLTKLFDMYCTPFDTLELTLAGSTAPPMGVQPFGWTDVYDFQVGDEFHYRKIDRYNFGAAVDSKIIKKLIGKTVFGNDSVHYTFSRCSKSWYPMPPPNTSTAQDTVFETQDFLELANDPAVELLPDEFLPTAYPQYMSVPSASRTRGPFNNRQVQICNQGAYVFDGGCYTDPFESFGPENRYAPGLGLTNSYSSAADLYVEEHRYDLVYFRKGTETWGTPVAYDCAALLTGMDEIPAAPWMTVYPNPATSEIMINISTGFNPEKYLLTDLSGRRAAEGTFEGPFRVQRNGLAPGIYLLTITDGKGTVVGRSKVVFE